MRRFLALSALGAVLLLLAACGGNGGGKDDASGTDATEPGQEPADDSGASVDACSLLTRAEVEAAVGNPVQDGVSDMVESSCNWRSDPDSTSASLSMTPVPEETCDQNKPADKPEVSGLGGTAWWDYSEVQGGVGAVAVCAKGEFTLLIATGGLDDTPDEAKLRTAAEDLVKKAVGGL